MLRGLDFAAEPGELTAVIGPNGAGKTTLLRALPGCCRPPPARPCSMAARSAPGRAASWPARLAYLPQERTVHWALTARAVVALGRLPHQPMGAGESAADARGHRARARRHGRRAAGGPAGAGDVGRRAARACWWRARWRRSRTCCSPTSRPPASIPRTSSHCSGTSPRLRRRPHRGGGAARSVARRALLPQDRADAGRPRHGRGTHPPMC